VEVLGQCIPKIPRRTALSNRYSRPDLVIADGVSSVRRRESRFRSFTTPSLILDISSPIHLRRTGSSNMGWILLLFPAIHRIVEWSPSGSGRDLPNIMG
jgi:hypothetical protein